MMQTKIENLKRSLRLADAQLSLVDRQFRELRELLKDVVADVDRLASTNEKPRRRNR